MKLDDLPIHTSLHTEPALEFACFEVETGEEIPRATRLVINQPTPWCGFRGSLQKNLCWQTVLHCNRLDSSTEVAVNASKIGIDEIHHLAVCKQIAGKC